MAGTCNSITPQLRGSTFVELSRSGRTGAPFSVRISTKSHGNGGGGLAAAATCKNEEGPSCVFVGPLETASKETLEALYRQVSSIFIVHRIYLNFSNYFNLFLFYNLYNIVLLSILMKLILSRELSAGNSG